MIRNISCQITKNALIFMIFEEYVINKGCRFLIYSRGKGICGIKLFVNITSRSWFTPVICLQLIRFKLTSPTIKLLFFSRLILLRGFLIKLLLILKCCMLGCLYIVPNIKFGLLGIRNSMKTDSSSLGLCICKSSRTLYDNFCDMYIWAIHLLMIRLGFVQYYLETWNVYVSS